MTLDQENQVLKKAILNLIESNTNCNKTKPSSCEKCKQFIQDYHVAYNSGGFGDYSWECSIDRRTYKERSWNSNNYYCTTLTKEEAIKLLYSNCPYKSCKEIAKLEIQKAKKELFGE